MCNLHKSLKKERGYHELMGSDNINDGTAEETNIYLSLDTIKRYLH